jgi:hypothetical protein
VNAVVFVIATVYLGGDAISGSAEQGRYYLESHGRRTEVSHQVFWHSFARALSVFITYPLAMIAVLGVRYLDQRAQRQRECELDSMLVQMRARQLQLIR